MIDLVSPDFWPIVPLVPHRGHIPLHLEVYRSSQTCTIIITYWMLTKTWTWSLPYGAPEIHLARSAFLDTWMSSCLSIWEVHLGYMCMIQLWIRTTSVTCSMIDDFMSLDFWPIVHLIPYWGIFPFRMRFTDLHGGHVLDDRWFHVTFSSDPSHILMPYWGIFPFRMRFTDLHGGHVWR